MKRQLLPKASLSIMQEHGANSELPRLMMMKLEKF